MVDLIIKHSYRMAVGLFAVFFVNILVGKVSVSVFDRQLPIGLDDATEFLILVGASVFFVIGILASEKTEDS